MISTEKKPLWCIYFKDKVLLRYKDIGYYKKELKAEQILNKPCLFEYPIQAHKFILAYITLISPNDYTIRKYEGYLK